MVVTSNNASPGSALSDQDINTASSLRNILVPGAGSRVGDAVLRILTDISPELFKDESFVVPCPGPGPGPGPVDLTMSAEDFNGFNQSRLKLPLCKFIRTDGSPESLAELVSQNGIDTIIPTSCWHTSELFDLLDKGSIPRPKLLGCEPKVALKFYDKFLTARLFGELKVPFAETRLLSELSSINDSKVHIAKPQRTFTGSERSVFIGTVSELLDNSELSALALTCDFVVQPFITGPALTIAALIHNKELINYLVNYTVREGGRSTRLEVTHQYDTEVEAYLKSLAQCPGVSGCLNLQAIVGNITGDKDHLTFFEVNARPSGTSLVRHIMGFSDVKALLESHLLGIDPAAFREVKIPEGTFADSSNSFDLQVFGFSDLRF